jgi:hypothetical protein
MTNTEILTNENYRTIKIKQLRRVIGLKTCNPIDVLEEGPTKKPISKGQLEQSTLLRLKNLSTYSLWEDLVALNEKDTADKIIFEGKRR